MAGPLSFIAPLLLFTELLGLGGLASEDEKASVEKTRPKYDEESYRSLLSNYGRPTNDWGSRRPSRYEEMEGYYPGYKPDWEERPKWSHFSALQPPFNVQRSGVPVYDLVSAYFG
jgi:hypothetical protein